MPQKNSNQNKVVFLSHAEEDAAQAHAIKEWLKDNLIVEFEIFDSSDADSNAPGSDWPRVIRERLEKADIALCLITPNSIERRWIYFESGAAYIRPVPVVPICFGGIKKEALKPPLQFLQAVELPSTDGEKRLLEVVARRLGLPRTPKTPTALELPPFSPTTPSNPHFEWLFKELDLIEYERKFSGQDVWVVSANLDHDFLKGPLAEVVNDNLERRIYYTYVIPKRPETYARAEAMKDLYSSKRKPPVFVEIKPEKFDNITETNITIYDPLPSPDRKGEAEVFVELPISAEPSERYWAKVHKNFREGIIGRIAMLVDKAAEDEVKEADKE